MGKQNITTMIIKFKVHKSTGTLAAYSDDLKGLLVIGANEQEIEQKLPGAIAELMDAMGTPVSRVELIPVDESETGWVGERQFRAEALREAA